LKKRKSNIRQHYVPQFYLRNFTATSNILHVYDFTRTKQFKSTPKKECYKKLYHDIDPDVLNFFVTTKTNNAEIIDAAINSANEKASAYMLRNFSKEMLKERDFAIKGSEMETIYNFIVLQLARSPFYRARLKYLCLPFLLKNKNFNLSEQNVLDSIHNLLIYGLLKRLHQIEIDLNDNYRQFFEHLVEEHVNIKNQLFNSNRLLLINKSSYPFITSSTPINVKWKPDFMAFHKALITIPDSKNKLVDIGNLLEFKTLYLPITYNTAIFFYSQEIEEYLPEMNEGIGIIKDFNSDLALNLNYSLFLKAHRVFSVNSDFEEYKQMKTQRVNPAFQFRFGNNTDNNA